MKIKLRIIPAPEPRTRAMIVSETAPVITGPGSEDYSCGHCDKLLIAGMDAGATFKKLIVRCPACGTYNETL